MKNKNSEKGFEAGKGAHKGIDYAMDKVESMKNKYNDMTAQLKNRATNMRHEFDGYIKKNPETSVLFAAGAGMLAGAIITAMIMKRR